MTTGAPPPSQANQGTLSALKAKLAEFKEVSENLEKIIGFIATAVSFIFGTLTGLHGWLRDVTLYLPRWVLCVLIVLFFVFGLFAFALSIWKRNKWHKAIVLLVPAVGGFFIGFGALGIWFWPRRPEWQIINAPELVAALLPDVSKPNPPTCDITLMLLRDQILERSDIFPGGIAYRQMVASRNASKELLTQNWAGFYTPLLARSTIPTKVTLRTDGNLNEQNASIGVYVIVWQNDGEQIKVTGPLPFGYESPRQSVSLKVDLGFHERAAMVIFVFPWTPEASRNLPKTCEKAVMLE